MTTRKPTARFFVLLPTAAVLLVLWITVGATRTAAVPPPHLNSGLVGMTFGQMVRFNITNAGEPRGMIIDGCRFVGADGRTLKEFSARTLLAIGQSVSFDIDRGDVGDSVGRIEVSAVVRFAGRAEDLVVTTQVVDIASGETGWAMPAITTKRCCATRASGETRALHWSVRTRIGGRRRAPAAVLGSLSRSVCWNGPGRRSMPDTIEKRERDLLIGAVSGRAARWNQLGGVGELSMSSALSKALGHFDEA